jgi:hypothetical protein
MASHLKENIIHGRDHPDDHSSDNRWRHQESSSFARHTALSSAPKKVREPDSHNGVSDLADFLNKSRIEGSGATGTHKPIVVDKYKVGDGPHTMEHGAGGQNSTGVLLSGPGEGEEVARTDGRDVRCGPLINYRRMEGSIWYGSVLIVTRGGIQEGSFEPKLRLRRADSSVLDGVAGLGRELRSNNVNGVDGASSSRESDGGARPTTTEEGGTTVKGVKLYADLRNVFWRFHIQVEMEERETHWEYDIPGLRFPPSIKKRAKQSFFVPAVSQSMRVMFHSCNGFSVGTDEAAWSGPALWNDVVRVHKETPFHVM